MSIGGVVINFVAKTRDAVSDVDRLTRSLGDVDKNTKTTNSRMGKLSGTMKAGLAAGAAAAGAAIFQLGQFMWDAGMAAVEDQKAADKLAESLRASTGATDAQIDAVEDWITTMQLATHVADTELRAALGKLTAATGDVDQAQRLAAAAADLSVVSGKSYATVAEAMAKAAGGNTNALKKMAPWLDVNKDGTLDLEEALGKLEDQYGDTAENVADQDAFETLKIIWDELKESLGTWLLPLVRKFGDWFKDPANKKAIQDIINKVGDLAEEVGENLVPAIEDFLDWVTSDKGKEDMRRWAGYIQSTANAVESLFKWFDKLAMLNPLALLDRINSKLPKGSIGGVLGSVIGRSSTPAAAPTATTTQQAAPSQPPVVIVTEEQIYRAVSSLLLRGDARNGRRVAIA